MQIFKKSEDDIHGFIRYSLGVTIVVVTLTCVAGANVLTEVAQNGRLPSFAFLSPKTVPAKASVAANDRTRRPVAIDYDSTASIGSGTPLQNYLDHPVILDPCTGRQK